MENYLGLKNLLVLLVLLFSISTSEQLQSSQAKTLLKIQNLLNYPNVLINWNNETDFCNTEPSSNVTVICYEESITQLHIIGMKGASQLSDDFSIDLFVNTLVKLPSLKVLRLSSLGLWGSLPSKISRLSSLEILDLSSNFFHSDIPREISSLTSLQTLILDGNRFTGRLPNGLGSSLVVLAVLSVKNNSLEGHLPHTLGNLHNLRVLALSRNNFTSDVPDLSSLKNLQVLDLEDNSLGPKFPKVSSKIQSIVLRNNKFTAGIPEEVQSYHQLEHMDISSNRFMGPFPPSLLSLPSITYLNIAGNKFTGMLFEDNQCNAGLDFVDLSTNLLSGRLPSCLLASSKQRMVRFSNNCLATEDRTQHPFSFCRNEALAVGILPHHHKQITTSKVVLALIICGSITGGIVLVCATIIVVRKFIAKIAAPEKTTRSIVENASSTYTSKLFTDAKYVTRAMNLGSLSLPSYRTFSSEELKVATNNFDAETFINNSSDEQMYRGQLKDGSYIAVRCLKTKRNNNSQNSKHHIELMSKLRHQHLVSTLGHCFECYLDDSSVSRIFLVFEYVQNGTLRSWISDTHPKQRLTWTQRIAAAIGVARGIQFLHTGIVPGIFSNNIKITDILLDQNFVAKICSYNLPILDENVKVQNSSSGSKELKSTRANYEEKLDVYDFGVILLEIISGKEINTKNEVRVIQNQLQESIMANAVSRKNVVDPAIRNSCSDESLKTMMELCCRCLLQDTEDRPPVEDIIWNLQFAAQVEESWRRDSSSSDASPISHLYNFQPNLSRNRNSSSNSSPV